jgi:hypothetical protein
VLICYVVDQTPVHIKIPYTKDERSRSKDRSETEDASSDEYADRAPHIYNLMNYRNAIEY